MKNIKKKPYKKSNKINKKYHKEREKKIYIKKYK